MGNIDFQYPAWYLVFCVLAGLTYALVLYYKDRSFRERSSTLNWALGVLRFLVITGISALLLVPLVKSISTQVQKPIVVVAQDVSESVKAAFDSIALGEYQSNIESLKASLEEEYEVKTYSFGDDIRAELETTYEDKKTNISGVFEELYNLYSNQNLGAIVLATDGIYNAGSNPLYTSAKLPVSVYSVALGDTTPVQDLALKRVFHNKIAYLGDRFSIQADITGRNLGGKNTRLSVFRIDNGKAVKLLEKPVSINDDNFFGTEEIILDADQGGVQHYRLTLAGVEGENTLRNNSRDIFVDVLDARQKILILAHSPHPDLGALRSSITTNKNYEVDIVFLGQKQIKLKDYDLLVLHQIPSRAASPGVLLNAIKEEKMPTLFIGGMQTNFNELGSIQSLVGMKISANQKNEVQAKWGNDFSLFKVSDELKNQLPQYPPLISPFGESTVQANASGLLYQRIGKVETKYPLWVLGEQNNTRIGVILGEGIWKWRLFDYLQHKNYDLFDELIGKTIQYLSLKEDKRRFRVLAGKNIFDENEGVVFDAELYNSNYELTNEPDVEITISNEEGRNYNFVFDKTTQAYNLNAGVLPVGNYTYRATTSFNGEQMNFSGRFGVQPLQLELFENQADHAMLYSLSSESGGAVVYPNDIASIATQIKSSEQVKPVIYQTDKVSPLINSKWVFFLFLLLLTMEWFARRYFGAY